jgi:SAM-dependent methyltransferase
MNRPEAHGYVTDVRYPDTFFRELSPVWLNYVASLCGAFPRDVNRPFTYLELGCGFATSTVVNAGALPHGEFYACDFNPAHIEAGRDHAAALGIENIRLFDTPFEELLALDLPDFDFIVLHGVYSWVNTGARESIRRIIERKLKRGGLLYLSYNCQPGWTVETPLRKLLMELASSASGDTSQRAATAAQTLQELNNGRLRYFSANPEAVAAVDAYVRSPSNYLAHEFMSQSWELFYSTDILTEMGAIGLDYLGSATLADNHSMLVVDEHAAAAIAALPTQRQRHLAMDFAVNRRFRRDVFVRGHPHLGEIDIARHLGATVIGAANNPSQIATRVKVPRGEVTFQDTFIREIRELMARRSMTIGEIVPALGGHGRDTVEIMRNVIFMIAAGVLQPFAKSFEPTQTSQTRNACPVLERALAKAAPTIPCETFGNGVPMTPADATAVSEWLANAQTSERGRVADFVRLGLIV